MSTPIEFEAILPGDVVRKIVQYTQGMKMDNPITTYELVSRPLKLPTEPGFYRTGGLDRDAKGTLFLSKSGRWSWVGNENAVNPEGMDKERLAPYLPLIPLRPASEVIDHIEADCNRSNRSITGILRRAREKFGVTP